MDKKTFLTAVSEKATKLGKEVYKHNTEITRPMAESVLDATNKVINETLVKGGAKPSIVVPHLGTFKSALRPGQENKKMTNPRTGETYFKNTEDKHSIKFKQPGKAAAEFNESRIKALKK
jgi:bacterial DNA-binding protein